MARGLVRVEILEHLTFMGIEMSKFLGLTLVGLVVLTALGMFGYWPAAILGFVVHLGVWVFIWFFVIVAGSYCLATRCWK